MFTKKAYRAFFIVLIVLGSLLLLNSYLSYDGSEEENIFQDQINLSLEDRESISPSSGNITVIASHAVVGDYSKIEPERGQIIAIGPEGRVIYYNKTYDRYFDVDSISEPGNSVLYVATRELTSSQCNASMPCAQNVVEKLDLNSGETTRVFSQITAGSHSRPISTERWHDVDLIEGNRLLVADISSDRVFIVNPDTGIITWEWQAQNDFSLSSGAEYPGGWTHLNHASYIPEKDWVMVSLRNQNKVVFIDKEEGLVEEWTLGANRRTENIRLQHNPEYIPERNGGPAVLVADTRNHRVVEYQRTNGSWNQSWMWVDKRMHQSYDAGRLSNGHTLITDRLGNRVFEVDKKGEIVWQTNVTVPYAAERLEAEDAEVSSALENDLESVSSGAREVRRDVWEKRWLRIRYALPTEALSYIAWILPSWIDPQDIPAVILFFSGLSGWISFEAYCRYSRDRDPASI